MKPINSISACLISCRNILLGGRSNENVLKCLEGILEQTDFIKIKSTKLILEFCVLEALSQIKNTDFVSAGMILNLIHNLPLSEESEQRWNIDYFLSIELPTFLENLKEVKSSRSIVLYVCNQLALQYLPKE